MDTIYWHMNVTQGGLYQGVNLQPGANLNPVAKCTHVHSLSSENKSADQLRSYLICAFVFAYAKSRLSHDAAQ